MLHTNDDEIVVRAGMIVRLSQSSSFSASAALEEGAEPHSYTLAMVIEVLRRSKELIVCALPDEEGKEYEDAEAMKRGATPVLGVVKAVKRDADDDQNDDETIKKDSWTLPVSPVRLPENFETDSWSDNFKEALESSLSSSSSSSSEEQDLLRLSRTAARFCHYALCGNGLCDGVFRIVGGDARIARLRSDDEDDDDGSRSGASPTRTPAQDLAAAQAELSRVKLQKAQLKKKLAAEAKVPTSAS